MPIQTRTTMNDTAHTTTNNTTIPQTRGNISFEVDMHMFIYMGVLLTVFIIIMCMYYACIRETQDAVIIQNVAYTRERRRPKRLDTVFEEQDDDEQPNQSEIRSPDRETVV
ncbi:hypothetical protein THOM_0461 [Trachipleistophora hominis]|uniref:Uncharacterized protein n=1 Tax=Trachipleistophora hominis TaxID=72359 RepID=L7JYZ5_TRAHO|nr:hypothetical protein THOM_0461 [Trachipleistophora hominis]